MANGFVNQFTTGRPYVNPRVNIAKPQFSISVPKLPNDPEDPSDEPSRQPTRNPSTNPTSKPVSQPRSTGVWGDLEKVGEGALGLGATALAGLSRNVPGATDVIDAGRGIFTRAATDVPKEISVGSKILDGAKYNVLEPAESTIKGIASNPAKSIESVKSYTDRAWNDIINSDQFDSIASDLGKVGSGFGEGLAVEAPLAAGTEAVGGGPEDPFADLGAGVEELTGGLIGGGEAAAPMIANGVKSLFSLAA